MNFFFIKRFFQKIKYHYLIYTVTNPHKKFRLINYLFWILLYRKLICPVIALFLLPLYFALYPFIKIRFIRVFGSAIGHFAATTELVLCELDTLKNDNFINLFYLEHSLMEPSISNMQLYKMWKRTIFILPLQLSGIIIRLDKYIMYFLANKKYGMHGEKIYYDNRAHRDIKGYLEKMPRHLFFTDSEHEAAKQLLEKIGIKQGDRYVCLLVRSAAYNKGHPTWDMPERNSDLLTYIKACNYLAEKRYTVLRMGKVVDDYFQTGHPRVVDYARSEIRSDFLDIYLSATCHFFITTGSGLDEIAAIFRKPLLYTNMFMSTTTATWYPHRLFIPKKLCYVNSKKLLTSKEQTEFLLYYLQTRKNHHVSHSAKEKGVTFFANTENEILEVVKEMEARTTGMWTESEEDQLLQAQFWKEFPKDLNTFNKLEKTNTIPLHGKISVKIGANFLRALRENNALVEI